MKPWKLALLFLALGVLSVILHNVIYGLTHVEEGVFFILTFVFALGFIVAAVFAIIASFRK